MTAALHLHEATPHAALFIDFALPADALTTL
jgi:hypothetical protein